MTKRKHVTMIICILAICLVGCFVVACDPYETDTTRTVKVANKMMDSQQTPTDISYSLERYNLIRRAYWVNGMREKAIALPCEVVKPLGYITLFAGNAIVGSFTVDGKVSSLNSFLTPDYQYFTEGGSALSVPRELADVDGSFGENDNGIFFFTTDGKYVE